MVVAIYNGFIQVNELNQGSSINFGKNVQNGTALYNKLNQAVGQNAGNFNLILSGANVINDPDISDFNLPNAGGQSPITGNPQANC